MASVNWSRKVEDRALDMGRPVRMLFNRVHFQQTACAILVARHGFESTEVDRRLHKSNRDATLAGPVVRH